MFLKKFPTLINSLRKKTIVGGFLSNQTNSIKKIFFKKRIKGCHKFLKSSNHIYKLNLIKKILVGSYIILS